MDEIFAKFRELYGTKTKWINHLNVWCNVLQALTIARGRYILGVDERVLIQESMFSGQRQRKGLSKVDAYLNSIKSPTYHLNTHDLHDILGTATPFNTTSNLVWDTMQLVYDDVNRTAQEECNSIEKIESLFEGSNKKTRRTSGEISEMLAQSLCGAYTSIIGSSPENLVQLGNHIADDKLVQTQSAIMAPQRAAVSLLGNIATRIWQLEGIWADFHISEFVNDRNNVITDLQKMWLVWVSLLGNPIDAERSTYEGGFSDHAIQGAATLLASMGTMLSANRVTTSNHTLGNARKTTECNMVDDSDPYRTVSSEAGTLKECEYPIISDPLGNKQYLVEWMDGGPMFGKACDTMWHVLLDEDSLSAYSDKCRIATEHTLLSGLAMICFNELSIKDKQ
ncbi:hypothetical protein H4217_003301 [Coemansia sp. RSA 1939]|nr:hypothetical protein H4217_003301 [Coemansia sp. RSA 1939]